MNTHPVCGCDFPESHLFQMVSVVLGLDRQLSALPALIFAVNRVKREMTGRKVAVHGRDAYSKLCIYAHTASDWFDSNSVEIVVFSHVFPNLWLHIEVLKKLWANNSTAPPPLHTHTVFAGLSARLLGVCHRNKDSVDRKDCVLRIQPSGSLLTHRNTELSSWVLKQEIHYERRVDF